MVEYILLLVVTVSLIIGAKGAFKNLDSFMNSYIGDYTVCLMEYGELPSLGVTDADQKKHTDTANCDKQFEGFTFASGRPPVGGSNSASSNGRANSAGRTNNAASRSSQTDRDSSGADSSDRNPSSRRSNRSGRSSPYAGGQISRAGEFGTGDGPSIGGNKKTKVIEDEDLQGRGNRAGADRAARRSINPKLKYRVITGALAADIEKNSGKRLRGPSTSVKSTVDDSGGRFRPYKKIFTPPEPKLPDVISDGGSGFTFGNLFRWLIIGAMILAIVVFFGGQIMNYSNSDE